MALVISDRVKETTVTTGTGTVTLAGAVTGFRTFGSVLSVNDTTYYAIVSSSEFEVGVGTLTGSSTLTRDTVLSSSNNGLKVDFGAGSKNVFITQPADKAIYQDASGNVAGLDTDNVTEGSTNLYFTNERVDDRVGSLLVAGDNVTLSYDDAAGTLTISATEDNLSNNDTDDLAEGSTNLYYTSARANADFDTRLATKDTDDLSEGATNLYYTDARADARVNLQTGSNLDLSSKSTSDLSEGTNLYYTTARFDSAFSGKSTSDLSEGTNLYYTDARFDTRLATKTTDNLTEGSNLYYTNERVDDRVSNLLQDGTGISFAYDDSNNVLTPTVTLSPFSTSNLSEGTNLYFTNERVDDRVANLLTAGSNITLTYDDTAGTLTIAGVEDDLSNNDTDDLSEGATNLYFTNERVDDRVSALVQNGTGISWSYNDVSGTLTPTVSLSAFSTSDLSEGTNLYYTTARFDSAFSGKSTSDLSEGTNLYYTTARFDTAFSGKTTDNLTEGSTNLYYTDTRANSAIDARVTQSFVNALNVEAASVQANSVALGTDTTGNYIATIAGTANKITVTGSGSESAAVTLTLPDDVQIANDLTVAGDLTVNGATTTLGTTNLEVSDNLFELNAGLTTAPVNDSGMLIQRGTSDNAIFMWDESADKFALGTTTSDATVTGNITITTGSLVANLEGNVTGNVTGTVSSLSNHDTDDLSEGSSNLYYTDARSRAAISASGDISYDSSTGVISFTQATAPVTSVNTQTGAVVLDTDDISEGVSNLYYTAARFNSAFAAKSTSDLSEGTNLYLTQERVEDYVGGMVSGNTETGIAVTYDDTLGKLNFVIDTLNQDTTGNAATATALQTARNFSLTGDVTASAVSFDGTANVALSTSIAANTVGITELNVTDGTNGQVLTTDGAGNLSFSSAASAYGDSDVESYLDGGTSTPTFASATVSGDFTVDTNRLYVDSTNDRVGIALSTPPHRFSVGSANDDGIALYDGTNDLATIFRENNDQARFSLLDTGTVKVRLSSKPSDANYINNGGDFLVGKTSADNGATVGIEMTATDKLYVTDSASSPIIANRLASDGNVIVIQKDGTSVGTLAARIGDLVIGNNDVGLRFSDGGDSILPAQSGSTGDRDNAIDLGASGARFKDAYLGGNLAIGTTSPQGTLHVKNTSDSATLTSVSDSIVLSHQSGSYTDGNYYGVLGFSKANSNGATLGAAIAPVMDGTGAGTDLTFSTALAAGSCFEKMRITDSGNVGIGNTSPQRRLTVGDGSGSEILSIYAGNASSSALHFTDTNTATDYQGFVTYTHVDEALRFGAAEVEGMRLTSTGLGIGTTSPDMPLTVVGNTSRNAVKIITSGTGTEEGILYWYASDASTIRAGISGNVNGLDFKTGASATQRMRIDSSGNVGIGTTSPVSIGGHTGVLTLFGSNATALVLKDSVSEKHLRLDDGNLSVRNSVGDTHLMVLNDGNVGIGTGSPATTFHAVSAGSGNQFRMQSPTPILRLVDSNATGRYIEIGGENGSCNISADPANNSAGATSLQFSVDGSEKGRFLNTGGLTFNGDTAAANALDDYEEGEWTPTCPNVTLTSAGGHYTKIGNRVWVTFYLQFPTTSDGNAVQVNNLPFTVRNHDSGQNRANGNRGGWTVGYSNSGQELRFLASSGTTTITAHNFGGSAVNNNNVSAKSIYGGGYYEVA